MKAKHLSANCRSVAMLLLLAAPAAAGKATPVLSAKPWSCWMRVYDAKHLAANPMQKTRSVRLFAGSRNFEESTSVSTFVYFKFRDIGEKNMTYYNAGYCDTEGNEMSCPSDWNDAGNWVVNRAADGDLLLTANGLYLNPSNYDAEERSSRAIMVPAGAADRTFKLKRVGLSFCR